MKKKLGRLLRPNLGAYFVILFCFALAAALMQQYLLAGIELLMLAVGVALHLVSHANRKKQLKAFLEKTSDAESGVPGQRPPFPMISVRISDGGVLYANDRFVHLTGFHDLMSERQVTDILPGFDLEWLLSGKHEYPYDVRLSGHRYRVYGMVLQTNTPGETQVGVLYFADLTELYLVRDEYVRSRPVVSIILVDNYEELTKKLSEGAVSNLNAKINDAITHWTEGYHGLLRRLERNRYLLVFEKRDLKHAIEDKFSLLEEVHNITNPAGLAVSLSMGLGVDGETFEENYQFASLSIDMALSRGGDQAVIKDRMNFNFYGGRNQEAEKHSRVRSRVTANSMMELFEQSSNVLIMGHKNADLDAIGAALGIFCMCRKIGKQAHIVMDIQKNMAPEFVREILQVPAYADAFLPPDDTVYDYCERKSTLVVVDTNRPAQVEYQPLLETVPSICVVDHHRREADYIDQVVVNFHEPSASSASELVTEMLQYALDKSDILPIETKALLAGIFLDTKSFNVRTGERTFEAAAFLKQAGVDTVEVKKLLKTGWSETLEKYEIIKAAEHYKGEIAIGVWTKPTTRVLASQAADELLDIAGITASFVLYPAGDGISVSARSIGAVNVHSLLSAFSGGGNAATAGAQIKDKSMAEVEAILKEAIDKYYEE